MSYNHSEDDIPLDEIFEDLALDTLGDIEAQRAIMQWTARRRILYVRRARCHNCGAVHDMPNDRILVEWAHADGTKKWCATGAANGNLPLEVDYLDGGKPEICQYCIIPTEETS